MNDIPDEAFFTCKGVKSTVHNENGTLGHILMLDAENIPLRELKKECRKRFDVYAIFRSSLTGYHVYNPAIRSFEDTYNILSALNSLEDDKHAEIGYKREDWVLRTSDKPMFGKIIPKNVYCSAYMNKHKTYSYPHLKFLDKAMGARKMGYVADKLPTAGKTLEKVEYRTYK